MTIVRANPSCNIPLLAPRAVPPGHSIRQPCTSQQGRRPTHLAASDVKQSLSNARLDELANAVEAVQEARKDDAGQVTAGVSAAEDFPWLSTLSITLAPLLLAGPAFAYTRVDGEEVLKNVAGGAYAILVCVFFVRLFRRRAKSGTTQSLRSASQAEAVKPESQKAGELKQATPLNALWGAIQAGVIAYFLFQLCGLIDSYFARQELPSQYTAHNITITLRTVVRGLAYLITFLFCANSLGLAGLSLQLFLYPDSLSDDAGKKEVAEDTTKVSNDPNTLT